MRDQLRKQPGLDRYREQTAEFRYIVEKQFARHGCPQIAADNVIALLDASMAIDPAVRRLVKCAAVDVALADGATQ